MKLSLRLPLLSLALAVIATAFQTSQPEFSLKLEMEHDTVKVGSEMKGRITFTNTSSHDIEVYRDKSGDAHQSGYTIEVKDSQGNTPTPTIEGTTIFGSGGTGTLKPGEIMKFTFNLNKLYRIGPGTYSVRGKFLDAKSNAFIASNLVTVTVTQ